MTLVLDGPGVTAGPDVDLSPLDRLRSEVERKVARPPVLVSVPERPGWRLRVNVNIPSEDRQRWLESCTDEKTVRLDGLRFAAVTIASQTEAIIDPDGVVVAENETPLTFKSPAFLKMLGVDLAADAVFRFFAIDPHVDAAASKIYEAAGYGDEVEVDPTHGSSSS